MKRKFLVFYLILLIHTSIVYSQGGGGRSSTGSPPKQPPTSDTGKGGPKKTTSTTAPRIRTGGKRTQNSADIGNKPIPPKELYARLTIAVNEPESEIFIMDDEGSIFEDADSYTTDELGSPYEESAFPVGTYTLTVRKNGFSGYSKRITVTGGKANKFSVSLTPTAAFLSVSTNVSGARIEIETVGDFEDRVDNQPLAPGRYRLSISKNGYETQTREIVLSRIGERENLSIGLTEIPTAPLTKGGKISLAVRIEISQQISSGTLVIERQRLTFQSDSGTGFVITRGNAVNFTRGADSQGSFIEFQAHGFFGNKFDPRKRAVRVYPSHQDAESLFKLIESWRLGEF